MRRIIAVVLAAVLVIAAATSQAFAQDNRQSQSKPVPSEQVVVSVDDLTPDQLAKIKARKLEDETRQRLETAGEYAKWGHQVGVAVNETLAAVTEQTAKFADTRVGQWGMFLVTWKIFGKDFAAFFVCIPLMMFLNSWILWSYRRNCIPKRILIEHDLVNKKKTYEMYEPKGCGEGQYMWGHVLCAVLVNGVGLIVMFAPHA